MSVTIRPRALIFGMWHDLVNLYQVCSRTWPAFNRYLYVSFKQNSGERFRVAYSALSSVVALQGNDTIRENKLIKRFLKGVFNKKQLYRSTLIHGNVSTVLQYLKKLSPSENLPLLLLSCKLAMLFALLSGQRGQSLYLIDIRNIEFRDNIVVVRIGDLLKSSSPTIHSGELVLEGYTKDTDMCIVNVLKTYLEHTKLLRGSGTRLFIASQKPHHPISRDIFFTMDKTSVKKCRNILLFFSA